MEGLTRPMLRAGWLPAMLEDQSVVLRGVFPGRHGKLLLKQAGPDHYAVLMMLQQGGRTPEELMEELTACGVSEPEGCYRSLLPLLQQYNLLVESTAATEDERYDRQVLFFSAYESRDLCRTQMQERLRSAAVVLVGVGGIGNWVALTLASAGVGKLVLVDPDEVSLSNLNRQVLFTPSDVGLPKTEVAARRLKEFRPDLQAESVQRVIKVEADLEPLLDGASFVMGMAGPPSRTGQLLSRTCVRRGVSFLLHHDSLMGPLCMPGKTACYDCMLTAMQEQRGGYQTQHVYEAVRGLLRKHPSFAPFVAMGAIIAAEQALRFLAGHLEPVVTTHLIGVDTTRYDVRHIPVARHPGCPVCGGLHGES